MLPLGLVVLTLPEAAEDEDEVGLELVEGGQPLGGEGDAREQVFDALETVVLGVLEHAGQQLQVDHQVEQPLLVLSHLLALAPELVGEGLALLYRYQVPLYLLEPRLQGLLVQAAGQLRPELLQELRRRGNRVLHRLHFLAAASRFPILDLSVFLQHRL
jgi:hypothetical protein